MSHYLIVVAIDNRVPYWADRLGKTTLSARQLSPRGGRIDCELNGDRVYLSCMAVKYMEGYLTLLFPSNGSWRHLEIERYIAPM